MWWVLQTCAWECEWVGMGESGSKWNVLVGRGGKGWRECGGGKGWNWWGWGIGKGFRCGEWGCYERSVDGRKWKIWKAPPYLAGYGNGLDLVQV